MDFRTEIKVNAQNNNQIDYASKVLLLGSCFSQNIASKLKYYQFDVKDNLFGILFNPISIEKLIINSLSNHTYSLKDLVLNNEQWHCLDAHSDFSDENKAQVLSNLNTSLSNTKTILHNTSHLIITLGTAWVYKFLKTNEFVANCHKIPQKEFQKQLLSVAEIKQSLDRIKNIIKEINANIQIIFTVSPVRHLKDGFTENNLSKAHLISAIHQVIDTKTHYFPAYEIMMDDLRDYRFYTEDMLHPNTTAIKYIWEKFALVWINKSEQQTINEIEQIQRGLLHKPFNQKSKKHQEFIDKLNQKIKNLEKTKGIHFISY